MENFKLPKKPCGDHRKRHSSWKYPLFPINADIQFKYIERKLFVNDPTYARNDLRSHLHGLKRQRLFLCAHCKMLTIIRFSHLTNVVKQEAYSNKAI